MIEAGVGYTYYDVCVHNQMQATMDKVLNPPPVLLNSYTGIVDGKVAYILSASPAGWYKSWVIESLAIRQK